MSSSAVVKAFRILGIAPTQDHTEIRRAWRALVRTYHPDLAKTDRAATNRKLAEINEAFDVLMASSAETRRPAQPAERTDADVARRMAEARRAEARRQSQARQAAAEREAHAARMARQRAQCEADAEAEAQRARTAARAATRAKREAEAAARRSAGQVVVSQRNPAVDHAVRAFSAAIASFGSAPKRSKHNTTC